MTGAEDECLQRRGDDNESTTMPPLNASEWKSAREILALARQLIIERSWQQGATEPTRRVCADTALEAAWKELGRSLVDFEYSRAALSEAIGLPLAPFTMEGDPLDVPYWGRNAMYWNDAPDRTIENVYAAFDKAVSIASRREAVAIEANAGPDILARFDASALKKLLT